MSTIAESPPGAGLDLPRAYRTMLLTRALDERIWALAQQGRVGITGPVRGHEAAQVGSALALRPGQDIVVPYYRDVGVALALGLTPLDILLGTLDRADDPFTGARQMPFHFTSRRLRIPSPSTSIATQIPHAVGAALAARLRGEDAATIVYFGDGATSKADFHEGLNFASIHRLPVVFFCENNQYAISVPLRLQMPVRSVAERAASYGVAGRQVDGTDVEAVYQATREALAAVPVEGPILLEALLYRLGPHTSHDDDTRYRSRDEVARWEERDPLRRARELLLARGLMAAEDDEVLWRAARNEVEVALARAEAAADPAPDSAFREVLGGRVAENPFIRRAPRSVDDTQGVYSTGTSAPRPS